MAWTGVACKNRFLSFTFTFLCRMARRHRDEKRRFMVLGGDDALMDEACATILGEREKRDTFKFGELTPRNAPVGGRQVSVLKTPSYWLEHLKSYFIFSHGVKSVTFDMNHFLHIQLFPGPHAFLLVLRDVKNSGKDHYLLHALSDAFGKEVLDYCMILLLKQDRHNDPKHNNSLKMCGSRCHILQNTDESVNMLLEKIEAMTQQRSSCFFTNILDCFRKAESYFRDEFNVEYKEMENKLRSELGEKEETLGNLAKEVKDMREQHAKKVRELNEKIRDDQKDYKIKEVQLRKELNASKIRENQLKKELHESKIRENQLNKLLMTEDMYASVNEELSEEPIIGKARESQLKEDKEILSKQVEQLKHNERQLQNNQLQSECNVIQSEQDVQDKEKELQEREEEQYKKEEKLDERAKKLEVRERKLTPRDAESM